ncbi:hypothetical protein LTR78_002551 [Recurvomyces mirabilis]|uniref:Methyltransferase-domain-containing protein n=1 Tax=Recurvomyces mirabilis TaxID=574656 RepID=A0AAE1C4J7_9PEZI|nr:hypothetical protein LTR78_002551 [Recurvomyces mirabilis]KAK5157480.1 hypothetical protein LTS14_004245 [Recurvomyces mirabilis]
MHYIRFLKLPKAEVKPGTILVKSIITITTDLGETFYPTDLDLIATLRSSSDEGEIHLRRRIPWPAHARSLPITFYLSRQQDVDWPACVHVAVQNPTTTGTANPPPGFLPEIVDIWSGLLNPPQGLLDSGQRVERRFLSLAERSVSLLEDAGDSIARHLWDGSQVLAQYIDHTISVQTPASPLPLLEHVLVSATYRRLHVLELGCGCGSVGISVAQSIPDCDVLLTDLPEVTELVEANVARMKPAMSSQVTFAPLDWEVSLPETLQNRTNDLIIVSECTYNTDTLSPLVTTLVNLLARSPKAVIVVSTKTRHPSEAGFFDMMRDAGIVEAGAARSPLPGLPGDGYADAAMDVGLYVFCGEERGLSMSPRGGGERKVVEGGQGGEEDEGEVGGCSRCPF